MSRRYFSLLWLWLALLWPAAAALAASPSADFSATPTTWNAPSMVSFTDASTGSVSNWLWTFGDGVQSDLKNPSHVYDRPGKYTVTLTVTSPGGSSTKTKTDYITVEEYVPVGSEFLVAVDGAAHARFGLYYPATYKFRLPAGSANLSAQYRYWQGPWKTLPEKQRSDNFNGLDAVRFDYAAGFAYVSARFSRFSDNLFLRLVDANGQPVNATFDSIPKFYDERKAAVSLTLDDWDSSGDGNFRTAVDLLASENLYFTVALIEDSVPWASVQQKINQVGDLMEIASHSIHHSCSATDYTTYGYDTETIGARDLIRNNLTYSAYPYVPVYAEPCGYSDATLVSFITAGNFLVTRSSNDFPPSGAAFADWDPAQGRYGRGAVSFTDSRYNDNDVTLLNDANALFNASYSGGNIYTLMDHPWKGFWYPGSYLMQHLDYIKGRSDVWYVPFGQLYQYHFVQEMRGNLKIQPLTSSSVVAGFAASPTSGTVPLSVSFTDTSAGNVTGWLWDFGDSTTSTAASPSHVYNAVGTYTVKMTVTGPGGSNTTTRSNLITVNPVTLTSVAITAPVNGASFTEPAAIPISATATAGTGTTIKQVDFYSGSNLLGSSTGSPYAITWNNVAAGSYPLTAKVTDSAGTTKTSTPVTVNVVSGANPTIQITAPSNGSSFLAPATIALSASATAGTGAAVTRVDYFANGAQVATASSAPFGATWSNVATGSYTITAAVTDSNGATATSAPLLVSVTDNTLPLPWATQDVGSVGLTGSASYQSGVYLLTGSGADIWGSADAFRFVYQPLVGDGQIVAKVTSLQNINPYSKGGVMMRETLSANAVHAMIDVTPQNGSEFLRRVTTGGTTAANAIASVTAPYWVKLVRSGNTFTGYISADNASWIQVGSSSIAMANTIYAGLVVTSHYNTKLCTAAFEGASVTGSNVAAPTVVLSAPGSGASFTAPANITLSASATAGSGVSLKQVEFFANNALVGTATSYPYSVTWSNVAAGAYSLTAKVTDSLGYSATSAAVAITVASNVAPVVAITAPSGTTSYTAPATVSLTASATPGSGATVNQVEFFANGNLIATATATPFSATWNNVAAGSYSLTARVTDSLGATATSPAVVITVANFIAPAVAITAPSGGSAYLAPATVSMIANASAGSGATVQRVDFFANSNLVASATAAPYSATWSNVAAGSYSLTAKITDSSGATATSAAVAITVSAYVAPTSAITAPATGASFVAPATIAIKAKATAGTGASVNQVDFYANGTLVGTATASPYTYSWQNVAAGSYSLTAKVTDSAGATATSAAVTVTVKIPPTVTITAPTAGDAFTAPATIAIAATAAGGGGATVKRVDFYAGTTLLGTATVSPYKVTWNRVLAGTYILTAKVTDSLGAVATSAPVTVNVALGVPDLTITKTHKGSFRIGQTGASYSITVSNQGGAPTTGAVTVTDTLPAGLTATALKGSGWTCTLSPLACTRSDALVPSASYPLLTLTVSVAKVSPSTVTNTATVSGGGDVDTSNNVALDPTSLR